MPSCQKIIGGCILFLPDHPPGDSQYYQKVQNNDYPVKKLQSRQKLIPPFYSCDGLFFTINPLNMSNYLSDRLAFTNCYGKILVFFAGTLLMLD
jgi:hypothetical protein